MSDYPDLDGFEIRRQPDDLTCGPTCLHAVYEHFGEVVPLNDILAQVQMIKGGGTLGVLLALHALRRGYKVKIITWNIQLFDPTWFPLETSALCAKLLRRARFKRSAKVAVAAGAYVQFLKEGGEIEFRDLEPSLLRGYLRRGIPVLTGVSATFLYREAREIPVNNQNDDVRGDPAGHFVVLTGYRGKHREVLVSDPLFPNPFASEHTYPVRMERLIGAIYLGVLTHDANLVVIEPEQKSGKL